MKKIIGFKLEDDSQYFSVSGLKRSLDLLCKDPLPVLLIDNEKILPLEIGIVCKYNKNTNHIIHANDPNYDTYGCKDGYEEVVILYSEK